MFDIHYHLIFGVDDGPKSLESSVQLAEASCAEGVTHIVATPHASDQYPFQAEVNRDRLHVLEKEFTGRLTLGLGCDFHLSYDNLREFESNPGKFTVNGGKYLMVEFPDFVNPDTFGDVFFRIMTAGVTPVITHPERNPSLVSRPSPLIEWVRIGCLLQVTAASLCGHFGHRAEALSRALVRGNYAHIIASDAHNLHSRPPAMKPAFDLLKNDFGQETAERLCIHNPRAVFLGETLPPQPEAGGPLYEKKPAKDGFFSRFFR